MDDLERISRAQTQWLAAEPDVDAGPQLVIGRLRLLSDRVRNGFLDNFCAHGTGEGEFDVLSALRRSGPPYELAPGEIAEYTMVTSGAVTKRVDRLEAAGLVVRRRADGDGRCRVIALTDEGLRFVSEVYRGHMDVERRFVDHLSAEEQSVLEELLGAWLGRVEAAEGQ